MIQENIIKKYGKKYFEKHKISIVLINILIIIQVVIQVEIPIYIGDSITDLTKYSMRTQLINKKNFELIQLENTLINLTILIILNVFFIIIKNIIKSKTIPLIVDDIRKELFKKIQKLPMYFFDNHKNGEILTRYTSDLDNIYNALNDSFFQIFGQSILIILIIIKMFLKDIKMAIVTMALTPVVIILSIYIIKKSKKYVKQQQKEITQLNGFINEQLTGQELNITNNLEKESIKKFIKYNENVRKASTIGQIWSSMIYPVIRGLSVINIAIIIYVGSVEAISANNIQKPEIYGLIIMFILFSQQYYQPLIQISSTYNQLQQAIVGIQRIDKIYDYQEEDKKINGIIFNKLIKNIEFKNVGFKYDKDNKVLKNVNLEIKRGETIAIVGPTGSGKTTLVNLINKFYNIDEGEILIDSNNINNINLNSLRKKIGIVLQESKLFTGSILDNINYGMTNIAEETIIDVAKKVNLHKIINDMPHKYQTKISENNKVFSEGQKQLLNIARILLLDPEIIILDEATANIDTITENRIQDAIINITKNKTTIIIAHRLKTIENADKIIFLKNGKIEEIGSHKTLIKNKKFYNDFYMKQKL